MTLVHHCPATGCRRLTLRMQCDVHRGEPSAGATAARLEAVGLTADQAEDLAQQLVQRHGQGAALEVHAC